MDYTILYQYTEDIMISIKISISDLRHLANSERADQRQHQQHFLLLEMKSGNAVNSAAAPVRAPKMAIPSITNIKMLKML